MRDPKPKDTTLEDGTVYYGEDTIVWYDEDGDQHCEYYEGED